MRRTAKRRAKVKKRPDIKVKNPQVAFCVSCGEELQDFCFSPKAGNLKAVQAQALRCKITGVRGVKKCAKLFIAQGDRVPASVLVTPSGVSKQSIEAVRKRVLERIRQEGKD